MIAPAMPVWAAIIVVLIAIFGASLALVGAFGMLRFRSFYERVHPATLAATLGATSILAACVLYFSLVEGRLLLKALLPMIFIPLVNPVASMLLARAAMSRDYAKALAGQPAPGSEDAEWQRKASELAAARAEAARHTVDDEPPHEAST